MKLIKNKRYYMKVSNTGESNSYDVWARNPETEDICVLQGVTYQFATNFIKMITVIEKNKK